VSIRWYSVVVDCHDVAAQGHWWAQEFCVLSARD
jgi:hypothetical protein